MYSPKTPLIPGKVKVYFFQDMTKAIRFNDTFDDTLTIYSALTIRSLEIT